MRSFVRFVLVALGLGLPEPAASSVRPSVERQFLEGGWEFRNVAEMRWHSARVPGCVHTDLLRNGLIPDPFFGTNEESLQWIGEADWVYRTSFDLPQGLLRRENVDLVFQGLDTYATVFLNGVQMLATDNMFREWREGCRSLLRERGNELTVRFRNVFDENLPKYRAAKFPLQAFANNDQSDIRIAPYSRKAQFHYGWDWGPRLITCGVWKPVYLEGWDGVSIKTVRVREENVSGAGAEIEATVSIFSSTNQRARLTVTLDSLQLWSAEHNLERGLNVVTARGWLANPRLWWTNGLGEQYLYRMRVAVTLGDRVEDARTIDVGVRSLEIVRGADSAGTSLSVRLNGVPVFMKGANYVPQDNFQDRVDFARYDRIVRSAAQAHMNMLRVWGGGIYESDTFYSLCDRYGILVWQDLMFACAMYPADPAFVENVRLEILDNVSRLQYHPSVALFCGNNENEISWYNWGWKELYPPDVQEEYEANLRKLFHEIIPAAVREADPTRYYHPTSPSAGFNGVTPMNGDIHYWGVWHGKEPFEDYAKNIGRFVSEYGFQSYPELSTVRAFTRPGDRDLHSPVMLAHQRCMADERRDREYGNRLIQEYLERYFRAPKDFESYLYVSQVLQAEGVRSAIEAHRRAMPICMGSLYWQIDDCWPVASWSSIDYYGRWKALHYGAREAFAPLIVSTTIGENRAEWYIVSDLPVPLTGVLEVSLLDFSGKELLCRTFPVDVGANASAQCAAVAREELLAAHDETQLALVSRLRSGTRTLAENISYFCHPMELRLSDPGISVRVNPAGAGYEILLAARTLAKSVCLRLDEDDGLFSDNYFDLVPGTEKRVEYLSAKKIGDFLRRLHIVSLVDSY